MINGVPLASSARSCEAWILIAVLSMMTVIQVAGLGIFTIVRYQLAISGAFREVVQERYPYEGQAVHECRELPPPEGWDHQLFRQQICTADNGYRRDLTWRLKLRQQPDSYVEDLRLARNRTRVVLLVDDSLSMTWSSGVGYDDDALYLQAHDGTVMPVRDDPQISYTQHAAEGFYFRGQYGNSYLRAPHADTLGGAISSWSLYYAELRKLAAGLVGCEVGVLTTSGSFSGFTEDRFELLQILDAIRPLHDDRPLPVIQALLKMLSVCVVYRHLVIMSDGESLNDGRLPQALFAEDGDPPAGLPGVLLAMAAEHRVKVHIIGPENTPLDNYLVDGKRLPAPAELVPADYTVSQLAEHGLLGGSAAAMDLSAYDLSACAYYELDSALQPAVPRGVRGLANATLVAGEQFYCATAGGQLFKSVRGRVDWLVDGCGGPLLYRSPYLIAGPDKRSMVSVFRAGPELILRAGAKQRAASRSTLYLAQGPELSGHQLVDGILAYSYSLPEAASCLNFDPVRGLLYAGGRQGNLYIFDQELTLVNYLPGAIDRPLLDIRSFSWRRKNYLLGIYADMVAAFDGHGLLWAAELAGSFERALVMDRKLYLSCYQLKGICSGRDMGFTQLVILDALNGGREESSELGSGRSLGPLIDLPAGQLIFADHGGRLRHLSLAELPGVKPESIGSYLMSD